MAISFDSYKYKSEHSRVRNMNFSLTLVFFAASCFAADPPPVMTCAPPPASRGRVPSLWEYILDQHPTAAAAALEMGDWKEHSDELYAFAFGHYLGNKLYSPVHVEVDGTNLADVSVTVDYKKLFNSMSSMTDSCVLFKGRKEKVGLAEFRDKYFDYEKLQSLSNSDKYTVLRFSKYSLSGDSNDSSNHCTFGQLRILVAECANDELATTAVDIAILKWLVRAVDEEYLLNFFSPIFTSDICLGSLLALELSPHIARLCRGELDFLLDRAVSELRKMSMDAFQDNYAIILNILIQVSKSDITEKILPIAISKGFPHQTFAERRFIYTCFRSLGDCQCTARLLQEKPEFRERLRPVGSRFEMKLHADQNLLRYCFDASKFPIRSIFEGEYFLQAEMLKGCFNWYGEEFKYYENATAIVPPDSDETVHVICVICRLRPSPHVAALLTGCQTEAELGALFRTLDWRYMTLAYSMTVAEVKTISPQ